ncbi:hypothetical protein QYE76_007549 [Lolium multiflorum]|uniref:Uncharacterized protein n=1 Tax=Lolium multiflorum TaxID=4521 RepID=A0AAD8QDV6_LOLMU|nr:hypothetical protein QYE76_007549 [Lolium multiflorum]
MKKAAELLKKKDEEIDINYVRTLVASAMQQQSKADTSRRLECNPDHCLSTAQKDAPEDQHRDDESRTGSTERRRKTREHPNPILVPSKTPPSDPKKGKDAMYAGRNKYRNPSPPPNGCHLPTYDAAVPEGPNWRNVHAYVDDIAVMTRKGSNLISDLTETFENLRRSRLRVALLLKFGFQGLVRGKNDLVVEFFMLGSCARCGSRGRLAGYLFLFLLFVVWNLLRRVAADRDTKNGSRRKVMAGSPEQVVRPGVCAD